MASTDSPNKTILAGSDYFIQLHNHSVTLRDVPSGEKVIFFLRDPVTRFVSGFNSRKRYGQPRYNIPWTRAEAAVFNRFESANALAEALSSPDTGVKEAATRAMRDIQHSKLSFSFWLVSKTYLISRLEDVFFIGFQERLETDFELLKMKLSLPQSIHLPQGDVQAHRSPDTLDIFLSPLAIANLRNWHSADYEIFGLCQQKADQMNCASESASRS